MIDKMVLDQAEADMLFSIEALEIQAKIQLADLELAYYQQREAIMSKILSASRTKEAAFDGAVRARGLDPGEYKVDIGSGRIVPGDASVSLLKHVVKDADKEQRLNARRGEAVTVRVEDEQDQESQ